MRAFEILVIRDWLHPDHFGVLKKKIISITTQMQPASCRRYCGFTEGQFIAKQKMVSLYAIQAYFKFRNSDCFSIWIKSFICRCTMKRWHFVIWRARKSKGLMNFFAIIIQRAWDFKKTHINTKFHPFVH